MSDVTPLKVTCIVQIPGEYSILNALPLCSGTLRCPSSQFTAVGGLLLQHGAHRQNPGFGGLARDKNPYSAH